VDARVPYSRTGLVDVGLFDLGQDTRLNLQAGNYLFTKPDENPNESAESLLLRYGLYASKIGGEWSTTCCMGTVFGPIYGTQAVRTLTRRPFLG